MSGLFFRKDTEFDTKIRPQEDTKYDTYRLWGKDPDTRDVAFDIYVKIPKEESIGNLVPKLANLASIVEDNKNQEIAYDTGKVEIGKIENSGIFENTFFEGRVELSATNTRRIKSSIFKNTNTVLNSLEGFDRCEFNGDNNISCISEKVNNGLFQNARCKNVTGLSFNCIKDFVGADGSYQELSGGVDEKLKITEKLDILW